MNLIRFYLLQYLYPANFLTWKTDMTTRLIQSLNDISSSSHHLPLYSSRPDRGTKKKRRNYCKKGNFTFLLGPILHFSFYTSRISISRHFSTQYRIRRDVVFPRPSSASFQTRRIRSNYSIQI